MSALDSASRVKKQSQGKWYHWYSPEDTPEERRLLLKLDLTMLPIALLSFWIKNMDYSNISRLAFQVCILRVLIVDLNR